jgi:hypothetical protein
MSSGTRDNSSNFANTLLDPESAVSTLRRQLPLFFDCYALQAAGISLVLATRVILERDESGREEEEFEPRLHHRSFGVGEVAMIQGAIPPLPSTSQLSLILNDEAKQLASSNSASNGDAFEKLERVRLLRLSSLHESSEGGSSAFTGATLGLPRISWLRSSAHYITKNATLSCDLFLNTSSRDFGLQDQQQQQQQQQQHRKRGMQMRA